MAETVILAEQILNFSYNESLGVYTYDSDRGFLYLSEGDTYSVIWDGTEYSCEAFSFDMGVACHGLGNTVAVGGEDNSIPFFVSSAIEHGGTTIVSFDTEETHTVAIYQVVEDEEPEGIVLKDRNGEPVAYYGIETVTFDTTTEGKQQTYTKGVKEDKTVALDMAAGDLVVEPDADKLFGKVTVTKPDTLTPENVRNGVEIGGILGTLIGDTEEQTLALAMDDGDMVIEPSEAGKVLSKVTIQKPETLVPENIAEGIDIAGIIGTLVPGAEEGAPRILVKKVSLAIAPTGIYTLATADELAEIGFDDASKKFAILSAVSGSSENCIEFNFICNWEPGYSKGSTRNCIYAYGVKSGSYINLTLASQYARINTANTVTYTNTVFGYGGELVYNQESTYTMGIGTHYLIVGCFS